MTSYLLDTSVLLHWLAGTAADGRRRVIEDRSNDVFVSAASAWEIAIKRSIGKLRVPDGLLDAVVGSGFDLVDITAADGLRAGSLPLHHRDPFDRMIIGQALGRQLTIVTDDRAFDAYGVELLEA